jgi:hypothetical protein
MRRPLVAAAVFGLAAAACSGAPADPNAGGRVELERVGRQSAVLLRGPGRADYCADDSILLVIAISREWTTGVVMRVALPLRAPDTLTVQPSLGGPGTAAAVVRPLKQGPAEFAEGGVVRLEATRTVSGTFDLQTADSAGVHVAFRGRWTRLPLRVLPSGSCATD